jgi:hypothetical protein
MAGICHLANMPLTVGRDQTGFDRLADHMGERFGRISIASPASTVHLIAPRLDAPRDTAGRDLTVHA